MNYIDDTKVIDGLIVQVVADEDPSSPRENDNLGIMLCWHPNYTLGDEQFRSPDDVGGARSMAEVARYIRYTLHGRHIIPLYLYDHGGISISAGAQVGRAIPSINGRGVNPFDSAGWDTSAVGFIYTTKAQMELMGTKDKMVRRDDLDVGYLRGKVKGRVNLVEHVLRAEVKEYDDFLTGNVWGYVVTKPCSDEHHEDDEPEEIAKCPHSEELDSCWGFIGDTKYAWSEAEASAKYLAKPE